MDSNLRLHQRVLCGIVLCIAVLCSFEAHAESESEAYRRQVKFETDRALDFRRFMKYLEAIDREKMSGVSGYKSTKIKDDAMYEEARKIYAEWVKREEAKKPSEEYVERMLASEADKEAKDKEAIRKEFVKIQHEIERAIENTRLDEAEEYGLAR
jgi:hypothetical protein